MMRSLAPQIKTAPEFYSGAVPSCRNQGLELLLIVIGFRVIAFAFRRALRLGIGQRLGGALLLQDGDLGLVLVEIFHVGLEDQQVGLVVAVDLEHIAVVPTYGWWNKRPNLEGYVKSSHYALIATITTPDTDIYTAVATQIGVPIVVET